MEEYMSYNIWAVLLATFAYMAIGSFWYSPLLFGKVWMRELSITEKDLTDPKEAMLGALVTTFLSANILEVLLIISHSENALDGLWIGTLVGLVIGAVFATNSFFERKSWRLYLITIGYHFVAFLLMGSILGGW
ncbi:DUF1761 domain-containing protein [Risungbinella massiliensis]|uniref:DUF1761 domain-containing protein n=1 Tax=Risungbinella massiliensis TaxID=1329796 RepID=UPI0005CC2A3A|nr:DUF1761 domain-containing protein [Risungbinella massiliensis]